MTYIQCGHRGGKPRVAIAICHMKCAMRDDCIFLKAKEEEERNEKRVSEKEDGVREGEGNINHAGIIATPQ